MSNTSALPRSQRIAVLEGENCFVLGAVVFVDPTNVRPERDSPDEKQEERNADNAIYQIDMIWPPRAGSIA